MRVIDLALKDLMQTMRNWMTAFFLLAMPIAFTLLMGFLFSGSGNGEDPRLPVGIINQDNGTLGTHLVSLLNDSETIRPLVLEDSLDVVEEKVGEGELAGAVVIPADYSERLLAGEDIPLPLIVDPESLGGIAAQNGVQTGGLRLLGAVRAQRSQQYSRGRPGASAGGGQGAGAYPYPNVRPGRGQRGSAGP